MLPSVWGLLARVGRHGGFRPRAMTTKATPTPFTRGPVHTPLPANITRVTPKRAENIAARWTLLVILVGRSQQFQVLEKMREVTWCLLRVVSRQCKLHTSQKFRRALQLYSVYSRMWGEEAARSMIASLRRTLVARTRLALLSAVCFTNLDWEKERISYERLCRATDELKSVGELCRATVTCEKCGRRQVIDQQMSSVEYCVCSGSLGYTSESREYESWRPFIEREHHIVWRRKHPVHNHLYTYKVYGSYDDVSLSAFMEVQLNCSYRTEWDDTALQLEVLGSHPHTNSDLVYWLVKFPAFFANREYIFKRRFTVNQEKKEVVIMSEAMKSDMMPEEKGVHRVNEYWSIMVIRARNDITQPGLEYTLTYFDNPGTSLPQSITNFIAATGFPNFLKQLHEAALSLQAVYEQGRDVYVSLPHELRYPKLRKEEAPVLEEPTEPTDLRTGEVTVPLGSTSVTSRVFHEGKVSQREEESLLENMQNIKEERSLEIGPGSEAQVVCETEELPTEISQTILEVENSEKLEKRTATLPGENTVNSEEAGHDQPSENQLTDVQKATLSDDPSCKLSSSLDTALSVGSKNVVIDLLEAMEVVTPDVEGKILLNKIEKLTGINLEDYEKQSVILEKLKKLKDRLKSFHEKATLKKQISLRKMEEVASRDHYDPLIGDEKTLVQLEMLFQAMKVVLQADRDMRTGKDLMVTDEEEEEGRSGSRESAVKKDSSIITHIDLVNGSVCDDEMLKRETMPVMEEDMKDKLKKSKTNAARESQPPDDPPPPPSSGEATSEKSNDPSSTGPGEGSEDRDKSDDLLENESDVNQSSSWLKLPYISAWWDGGRSNSESSEVKLSPDDPRVIDTGKKITLELDEETSKSFISQAWYIVGLGWIFHTKKKIEDECCIPEGSEAQEKQEHFKCKIDCDDLQSSKWYWYPVSGARRLYSWVFSASKESA